MGGLLAERHAKYARSFLLSCSDFYIYGGQTARGINKKLSAADIDFTLKLWYNHSIIFWFKERILT